MQTLPLQIGVIGHTVLLQQNLMRFQQIQEEWRSAYPVQIIAEPVYTGAQLQHLDGLLITGWHCQNIYRRMMQLVPAICHIHEYECLSLWGIAAGAAMLGNNSLLSAIDCTIISRAGTHLTTSILELPGYTTERFTATFLPEVQYLNPAPNLGILCQNQKHGIVAVRQGNHLASSFVAELTPQPYLYHYWLEMVADLKNSL